MARFSKLLTLLVAAFVLAVVPQAHASVDEKAEIRNFNIQLKKDLAEKKMSPSDAVYKYTENVVRVVPRLPNESEVDYSNRLLKLGVQKKVAELALSKKQELPQVQEQGLEIKNSNQIQLPVAQSNMALPLVMSDQPLALPQKVAFEDVKSDAPETVASVTAKLNQDINLAKTTQALEDLKQEYIVKIQKLMPRQEGESAYSYHRRLVQAGVYLDYSTFPMELEALEQRRAADEILAQKKAEQVRRARQEQQVELKRQNFASYVQEEKKRMAAIPRAIPSQWPRAFMDMPSAGLTEIGAKNRNRLLNKEPENGKNSIEDGR